MLPHHSRQLLQRRTEAKGHTDVGDGALDAVFHPASSLGHALGLLKILEFSVQIQRISFQQNFRNLRILMVPTHSYSVAFQFYQPSDR